MAVVSRIGRELLPAVVALAAPVAVTSRAGRYLPYGVAVLARIAGRYEPCWPFFAV